MTYTYTSERTGLVYAVTHTVLPDACHECGARGFVRFTTEEDEARYERMVEDYGDEDDYGPDATGVRECPSCKGTGKVSGNGDMHRWSTQLA